MTKFNQNEVRYCQLLSDFTVTATPVAKGISTLIKSFEVYVELLVKNCACQILFPFQPTAKGKYIYKNQIDSLPPSLKKRIRIIDKRQTVWRAVEQYLEPVRSQIQKENGRKLDFVAWAFYKLTLSVRNKVDVLIPILDIIKIIDHLLSRNEFRSESKARLSIIRGIFALFEHNEELPCFHCIQTKGPSLSERIEEILEDSYLLEASALRRFFGYANNRASINRDLRKLLQFISKNRSWAKGLLTVSSQPFLLSKSSDQLMNLLFESLPSIKIEGTAPIILTEFGDIVSNRLLIQSRRSLFQESKFTVVSEKEIFCPH